MDENSFNSTNCRKKSTSSKFLRINLIKTPSFYLIFIILLLLFNFVQSNSAPGVFGRPPQDIGN